MTVRGEVGDVEPYDRGTCAAGPGDALSTCLASADARRFVHKPDMSHRAALHKRDAGEAPVKHCRGAQVVTVGHTAATEKLWRWAKTLD